MYRRGCSLCLQRLPSTGREVKASGESVFRSGSWLDLYSDPDSTVYSAATSSGLSLYVLIHFSAFHTYPPRKQRMPIPNKPEETINNKKPGTRFHYEPLGFHRPKPTRPVPLLARLGAVDRGPDALQRRRSDDERR